MTFGWPINNLEIAGGGGISWVIGHKLCRNRKTLFNNLKNKAKLDEKLRNQSNLKFDSQDHINLKYIRKYPKYQPWCGYLINMGLWPTTTCLVSVWKIKLALNYHKLIKFIPI